MGAELPVRITADLSSFKRDLSAAQQSAKGLGTELEGAGRKGAHAGSDIGESLHGAHTNARALGGALKVIDPELGAIVKEAGHLAKGLKLAADTGGGLVGVLVGGGMLIAIGAIYKAWEHVNEEIEAAEKNEVEASKLALQAQLGLLDKSFYVNKAIALDEKIHLKERESNWENFAKTIAGYTAWFNPIAAAVLKHFDEVDAKRDEEIRGLEAEKDRNIELARAQLEVIEGKKKDAEAAKENAKAAQEAAAQWREFEAEWEKATAARADLLEQVAQREQEVADYEDEQRRKASVEDAENRVKASEDAQKLAKDTADAQIASAFQVADAFASATGQIFGDTKAGAIAEAIINVAVAATKSLTSAPFPANVALAGLTVAAGAAQVQKIQSTNYAHSGLAYEPPGGMAPDESVWVKRKNERMLTDRGAAALGGDSQIRRLNAGQPVSMGGQFVGITQFKHKMLDATLGPNLARPAAARTEIKAIAQTSGRVGHRLRSTT